MAYIDYSAKFSYKDLLTYQDMNQLGANDKAIWEDTKTRYYTLAPSDFSSETSSDELFKNKSYLLNNNGSYALKYFTAPVHLPHGCIITKVKLGFYCNDSAAGDIGVALSSIPINAESGDLIATAVGTTYVGWDTIESSTVSYTVNNLTSKLTAQIYIDNNDNNLDVWFGGVVITYTITNPLP